MASKEELKQFIGALPGEQCTEAYPKNSYYIKLLILGDGNTGKTCLLKTFYDQKFPGEYIPTLFDNYSITLKGEKDTLVLNNWDQGGREESWRLRPLSYPGTDCILLCFSVVNENSFLNITSAWEPEIHQYLPTVNIILVGTKIDLRNDEETIETLKRKDMKVITKKQGQALAKALNFVDYMECSSLEMVGVNELFAAVIKLGAKRFDDKDYNNVVFKKKSKCILV